MYAPLFTLVRSDMILSDLDDISVDSSSTEYDRPLEIQLVDDKGYPCASPISQGFRDEDSIYRYADGSRGRARRVMAHEIALGVDYITSPLRRRLLAWKQDRARVRFTPGYGARSEIAWRPPMSASQTNDDLTGRYSISNAYGTTKNTWFDDFTDDSRSMRDALAGFVYRRLIPTPGGTGIIQETTHENIFDPTLGSFGWGWWNISGFTLSNSSDGFGAADFPHATKCVRAPYDLFASFKTILPTLAKATSTGTLETVLKVKGHVGPQAAIQYQHLGSILALTNLEEYYEDWTRVSLQESRDFSLLTSDIDLVLVSGDASTPGYDWQAEFEIGPTMSIFTAHGSEYSQVMPNWHLGDGSARLRDYSVTTASVDYPLSGTSQVTFYVPPWFDPDDYGSFISALHASAGGGGYQIYLIKYSGNQHFRIAFYYSSSPIRNIAASYENGDFALIPGEMNTIEAVRSAGFVGLCVNGILAASTTDTEATNDVSLAAGTFNIGAAGVSGGSWPLIPTAVRLENEVWSAARCSMESKAMRDPGALECIIPARGRVYEIAEIPSTPRVAEGTTHWLGNIVLRQVGYEHSRADITTKEY